MSTKTHFWLLVEKPAYSVPDTWAPQSVAEDTFFLF